MNFSYDIILAPILAFIIVQTVKLGTDGIKGNFNIKTILSTYGGMPSAHSAVVAALTTMVAFRYGIESAVFAVTFIFASIIIMDAVLLRRIIDYQAQAIKLLISRLPETEQKQYPDIIDKVQHTVPQVLVGVSIGFLIALVFQYF